MPRIIRPSRKCTYMYREFPKYEEIKEVVVEAIDPNVPIEYDNFYGNKCIICGKSPANNIKTIEPLNMLGIFEYEPYCSDCYLT